MDFSFKSNEIKFRTLLVNCLIWKKMFTYFYNKFRPVNHMHYIKFGVTVDYSHNSSFCRRSLALWATVLSWHTVFTIGVLYKFTLVWYFVKQGTLHSPTSHLAHLYTLPFLWPWEQHRRQRSWVHDFAGQCLLWGLWVAKHFLSLQHLILSRWQQPEFQWLLPPRIWFFPWLLHRHLQWCALFRLLCMCISFVWSIWVQCTSNNLSCQQSVFVSYASVDISTHSELQCKR
jgi:hypothetical protein